MIPERLEYYILQSILNYVQAQLPTVTFRFKGFSNDNTLGKEEWVDLTCLSMPRRPSRVNEWKGIGLFQFSCFSRYAEARNDGLADAPYILAGKVARKIEAANIDVTAIDQNPSTILGAVSFHEAQRDDYVDEGALKLQAVEGFDTSNVHAKILDFPWSFAERFS